MGSFCSNLLTDDNYEVKTYDPNAYRGKPNDNRSLKDRVQGEQLYYDFEFPPDEHSLYSKDSA